MLARRDRRIGKGGELLDAQHVVDELGSALPDVERPAAEPAALGDDHTLDTPLGNLDLCDDGERLVLDAHHAVLGETPHSGEEQLGAAADQGGAARQVGVEPLARTVVERQYAVLRGLDQPQSLQLRQLLGVRRRQVPGLAEVAGAVVELPGVVVERPHVRVDDHPGRLVLGDRTPTPVVDAPVAEHLEVLQVVTFRCALLTEGVQHAGAFHG